MNTERPTPRTDAEAHHYDTGQLYLSPLVVKAQFSRTLERELAEARDENTKLRAALAMSDQPCVYCTLPADEMGRCKVGFPGCPRADDQMGCPHLGAALELNEAREELARLKAQPQHLPRPDKPGWWWCWEPDRKQWRVGWAKMEWPTDEESRSEKQLVWWSPGCGYDADKINVTVLVGSLWLPAAPPPSPEKGVEG